ncbi:MAG: PD40 domain-containing protein [Ktedonobacterales bacterium]|nr:PD40 domain-containing protein [Ktedonobacterales bacterium]
MTGMKGADGGNDEEARRQRREALQRLSDARRGATGAAPPPSAAPDEEARRGSRWLLLLAAVLCVAVIAAVASRFLPTSHPSGPPSPQPAQITLALTNLGCPQDATWSPDGKLLAVVGHARDAQACRSEGLLNLYDMTTGKLRRQVSLDATILPSARAADASITPTSYVNYSNVIWSPNGQRLAITFVALSDQLPTRAVSGLWVADLATLNARVLTRALGTDLSAATEWFVDGGPLVFPTPSPALSFTWGANSALLLDTILTPTSAPPAPSLGPIGSPSGPNFTIWQPGQAALVITPPDASTTYIPGAYTFTTDIATWSPDGTLIWDALHFTLRVEPQRHSPPSTQTLRALGLTQAPLLPVRDVGLQAVYDAMNATALDLTDTHSQVAQIAWRPDGRYLAAQPTLFASPPSTDIALRTVRIYDCATGRVVATLIPPTPLAAPGLATSLMRWSPDGTRLLLLDPSLNEAVVWGPSLLPPQ